MTEEFWALVTMLASCWGSALLFLAIGIWADRRKTPMHFYSGVPIDPKSITDVQGYNRQEGKMWKQYSIPYWLAGILSFWNIGWAAIVIGLACFPGIFWLVWKHHRIRREFKA